MTFWLALVSALVLTGLLMRVLRVAQMLDVPNARSSHQTPTPRGGGLAVMMAVALALLVVGSERVLTPVISALALAAVGLVDDMRSLGVMVRLGAQLSVAIAAVVLLRDQADVWLPLFLVVGVLGVVAYVNAFNFMDGVNGISALNAVLAGGWFVWIGHEYDEANLVTIGAALGGASLGFLPWNVCGRIFLGDVGSYGLGALIAVTALTAWSDGVPPLVVLAPLAVYFADAGWALIRRVRAGEPLAEPHRDHVYQRLVQQGWPHLLSAGWSVLVAAAGCLGVALLISPLPVLVPALLAGLVVLYLTSPCLFSTAGTEEQIP